MLICITRHGETEWNKQKRTQGLQNINLNNTGLEQAERLGKRLTNYFPDKIYCSDLSRAEKTAFIIGQSVNIAPTPTHLLREVCFGSWEGLTIQEIEETYPGELEAWRNDFDFYPHGGESLRMVQKRVKTFIGRVMNEHLNSLAEQKIVIVGHAVTCKVLLLELLGIPLNYFSTIKIDHTSLSLIEVSPYGKKILLLNDTCHLLN